ncbi:hypothetical protein [Arthrobacter sp. NEB 688]|uniref:hypothetical protein n=1 Tax=Arthrobacter sp. NEB 688 TaxID=904039 RepID=UPI0015673A66|nr:hypothetical protein [Arthrobacter sp. NEB 688]QKE85781.1 hypothetical protein HL663_18880 [Arthrobacter sp. NEB 688]
MAHATPASSSQDVLAGAARTELERIRRRWSELPLTTAQAHAPQVRAVVERLAAATAPGAELPDLGPAVLLDQLAVVAWDAAAAGAADVTAELSALRRDLP